MSAPTLQNILTDNWAKTYPTLGGVDHHTGRVVNALIMCRTPMLGAHRYRCSEPDCTYTRLAHNSCRNRHCPLCQARARAQWLTARLQQLLPTRYFHIVFTLPAQSRALVAANKRTIFALLFKAASETIMTLARDPRRLGGEAGLILMLHTWSQRLTFHPHLHGLIPGGVLAADKSRWIATPGKFFLPVAVVARMFRGKLLAYIKQAHARGDIDYPPERFTALLNTLYSIKWHVHLESPFKKPIRVVKYLAAYTNRVAISDKRLLESTDPTQVRFSYCDRIHGGVATRVERLSAREFIARFTQHILPRGFVKIRYYGLLSNRRQQETLQICRTLLAKIAPDDAAQLLDAIARELLNSVATDKSPRCPHCGCGRLRITERIPATILALGSEGND